MEARILDGRALATELRVGLAARTEALRRFGIVPRLLVVMVGQDESSLAYIRGMTSLGAKIGVEVVTDVLPVDCDEDTLRDALERASADDRVHGVILQQPLPRHLSIRTFASFVPESKDVDGTNPINAGRLAFATGTRFVPATPAAVMLLLERSAAWPLRGKNVAIVGRSSVVGLPVALLILAHDATVTIVHRATHDIAERVRAADVVIVATGRPQMVDASWIAPGAIVIDVGTTVIDGKLHGDVDFESVRSVASEITPVPGGVGPVTNIALMRNVVTAAESVAELVA
ncbi:MAG: bifunctional 5,10-methylenetetrahydrofolate dehydrogenase/5,10-methenyltetrahydrofolate cyclohydrolase [Vulcanimicrobiaceae bacterium]